MKDVLSMLQTLRRPPLLVRAARIGCEHYHRDRHLRKVLGGEAPAKSGAALMRLLDIEAELDNRRRVRDANYSVAHHVDVLVAMIAEAQLARGA